MLREQALFLLSLFLLALITGHFLATGPTTESNSSDVMTDIAEDLYVLPPQPVPSLFVHTRKIGVFLLGTGDYLAMVQNLVASMETHFCSDRRAQVHYFIFTDSLAEEEVGETLVTTAGAAAGRSYSQIFQEQLGWPQDTLLRYEMLLSHMQEGNYSSFDFLYWIDADSKFVGPVCEDVMGDLVGVTHPHYPQGGPKSHPYEDNSTSTAFVPQEAAKGQPYFVGAFWGGSSSQIIQLLTVCDANIQKDFREMNGYIAKVHDESHLNRYFFDHRPTILTPGYYYTPEDEERFPWLLRYQPKIVGVRKNSAEIRARK